MAKVLPMVSMEMETDEVLDMPCPMPIDIKNRPRFPYGLRITLTQDELKKLNLAPADAFVGGQVHGHVMMRITSVSQDQMESGDRCRVELQIESMSIESEDAENEADDAAEDKPRRRSPLYAQGD